MRIAIPQYQGKVSGAYELSQAVALFTLDFRKMSIQDDGQFVFPSVSASFAWMTEQKVQAVLVGTIDPDNAVVLSESGINVFSGAGELSPADTARQFMQLMRTALERRAKSKEMGECCGGEHGADEGECCGGQGHGDDHECCGKHEH